MDKTMSFKPFYVGTCEAKSNNENCIPFAPLLNEPLTHFPIQDPFGLRKAIVPIFKRDLKGDILGMGTAFHIDGWGTFLTADHVIDFARENPKLSSDWKNIPPVSTEDHPILFLGMGSIYGSVTIPDEVFLLVEHIIQVMREKDDSLAILNGQAQSENAMDLAVMNATFKSKSEIPHCLPVKASGWFPAIGDVVLAVGFPELNCEKLSDFEQKALLTEGMYGAYGRIRKIHPKGTSNLNSTPVFEVDGHWPSGMSGGHVFNSLGEVVGLVSRSLEPDGDLPGVSFATYFSLISDFSKLTPTIDIQNPMCRRGWAVLRRESWDMVGFFRSESEAQKLLESVGTGYKVEYGSNYYGTSDFIS
jgi:serine protease Do